MRKIHLKNCQKVILMAVVMFCTLSSLYAQVGQTVTGVVKDTEGEPLIGVSVLDIMMKQAFHWNLVMSVYLLI